MKKKKAVKKSILDATIEDLLKAIIDMGNCDNYDNCNVFCKCYSLECY